MALSDTLATVLSASGLVSILGAVTVFIRTRQQGKVVEANVIRQLGGTVGDFAEDVRRDAQQAIDAIRRDAERQIEHAYRRAEDAEGRAVKAERAAVEAQISAMEATATIRRVTSAVHSPYVTIEGLKAMLPIKAGANGIG